MASATHSIYLSDGFGQRLADASRFVSLKYSRVVNGIGSAVLVLPGDFDTQMIRAPDGRLEIWRKLAGSSREYLDTETVWLIKAIDYTRDDKGRATITVEADTPLCLLREPGRFSYYDSDTAASSVSAQPADDGIKQIARDNIGATALQSTYRDISAYVTIAPNLSLGASVSKSFAWRDLLKVMQELAAASTQSGTYLAFDIVSPTPDTMEFRTYVGQRGVDHRFPGGQNPVIISPDFGNMGACSLRYDYRNEVTFAVAGGKGEGAARLQATAQDNGRIGLSPFGLREKFVDATNYDTTTGLAAEAQAQVRNGRPRTLFRGKLLNTDDTRYGVHWGWGDFVTCQAFGQSLDCRIDAVSVTVAGGKETVEAVLRNDA